MNNMIRATLSSSRTSLTLSSFPNSSGGEISKLLARQRWGVVCLGRKHFQSCVVCSRINIMLLSARGGIRGEMGGGVLSSSEGGSSLGG